ncbi:hypothetical protein FIBSPDRAFT_1036183 [Athelia psychrophila]|uniref:MYND-type domain-containing protein n=1 Tax=Athelia psychrophila TaxID=1759441 RepID=A0A166WE01_9AGAM|nr:hypothetical protein FIBSPDRAFT_1036183 [Fibularhizoctonia sp. CBS 109695]
MCANCKIARYCNRECQREDWRNHEPVCTLTTNSQKVHAEIDGERSAEMMSIPMENVNPLLRDFVVSYRALIIIAMFSAFGYTSPHTAHSSGGSKCFCEARQERKVLHITLQAVPKLSRATKGRAAFIVKNAESLTVDALREASRNTAHPMYDHSNIQRLQSFDRHVEQYRNLQGATARHSMCFIKLNFHNGVGRSIFLKDFYYSDDPSRDYSSHWNPDNWLQYLKQEVARGKGWEPRGD